MGELDKSAKVTTAPSVPRRSPPLRRELDKSAKVNSNQLPGMINDIEIQRRKDGRKQPVLRTNGGEAGHTAFGRARPLLMPPFY